MDAPTQIAAALARIEGVFADMAATVDAEDLEKRRQLLGFRRALADCFVDLNRAVGGAVAAGRVDEATGSEYHARFAAFRRAVSLHQAEWPAVLISDDMAGYVGASQALRRKRNAFMDWMRVELLPHVTAR